MAWHENDRMNSQRFLPTRERMENIVMSPVEALGSGLSTGLKVASNAIQLPQDIQDAQAQGQRWNYELQNRLQLPTSRHTAMVQKNAQIENQRQNKMSMGEARNRTNIRLAKENLDKLYIAGNINEDQYKAKLAELTPGYNEAMGYDPTVVEANTTDANRKGLFKHEDTLINDIDMYNKFSNPDIPETQKKLLGFNVLKKASGDVGSVSDKERLHFLYGMMHPDYKKSVQGNMNNFMNSMLSIAQHAKVPNLEREFNETINTMNKALENTQDAGDIATAVGYAIDAFKHKAVSNPDYAAVHDALSSAWDMYLYQQLMHAPINTPAVQSLLKTQIDNSRTKYDEHAASLRVPSKSEEYMKALLPMATYPQEQVNQDINRIAKVNVPSIAPVPRPAPIPNKSKSIDKKAAETYKPRGVP